MENEEIVERLKYLRKDKFNLSQEEFSKKIGLKQTSYSSLEIGKRKIADRHIKPICNILNIREEWLRYGRGEIFNEEDEYIAMYKSLLYKDKEVVKYIIKSLHSKTNKKN